MARTFSLTLLATGISMLAALAPAAAQGPPPPGVVGGIYDSFGRERNSDNTLPRNDRVVQIVPNRLGGLRFNVFDTNGNSLGSALLVPKCPVSYDARIVSYVQKFETVPARRGAPVESVTVVFRINDPIGDYDVYFKQPGRPQTSEVLKRRDP